MPHSRRAAHDHRCPAHVTLRACATLPSLRRDDVFAAARAALAKTSNERFRLLHYSVQRDHMHLLVEGDGVDEVGRGIQGLAAVGWRRHGLIRIDEAPRRLLRR
jgi:putative transposase